jgi:hypothetical protein
MAKQDFDLYYEFPVYLQVYEEIWNILLIYAFCMHLHTVPSFETAIFGNFNDFTFCHVEAFSNWSRNSSFQKQFLRLWWK